MIGTIPFVMEEGKSPSYNHKPNRSEITIGIIYKLYNIIYNYIFSFYHGTSVSLGDAVIIFGGYDNGGSGHIKQNLKQIG